MIIEVIVTILYIALEMRVKKKELAQSEAELAKTMEAVTKLQKRLQDAEKLLVRASKIFNCQFLSFIMNC